MTSCTTTAVAGRSEVLVTSIVTVAGWPAASEGPVPIASASVREEARGDVRPACMSIATGALARSGIRAAEPSTKNAVEEKSATARATPTAEARVRRGFRRRSRRLYLSTEYTRAIADHLAIPERHDSSEPRRDVHVVSHDDKRRACHLLRFEHQVENRGGGFAVQLAGRLVAEDEERGGRQRSRGAGPPPPGSRAPGPE